MTYFAFFCANQRCQPSDRHRMCEIYRPIRVAYRVHFVLTVLGLAYQVRLS